MGDRLQHRRKKSKHTNNLKQTWSFQQSKKKAKTIEELFAEIISNDMANNIASFTNAKIQFMTCQHPSGNDSDKYSYVKAITCGEI